MNATRNRSQQRWGTMFAAAMLIATVGAIARAPAPCHPSIWEL